MYSSSSSSPSSSNPRWMHDVFINFQGEDTRRTFVSHLYAVLSIAGINTVLDNEKLEKGEDIQNELVQSIGVSRISIVVFSKNYAGSSWCLNELDKIMECQRTIGQVVLPVFYDVEPSVVRHQKGEFGKTLEVSAKSRYVIEEVMQKVLTRWKKALTEASYLSGWEGSAFRRDRELVKKIVEAILPKLDNTSLPITDFPVGLEFHVKQVVRLIKKQPSDVCMVGIWGMGGSGKTTVAKAIYNQIHCTFDCISFIENIREVCEQDSGGHIHLQQQLLSDILKAKEKIHSIALGTTRIQKVLSGKKALVVLDDVTDFQQIKALCGNHKSFGSGSLLIVTTRDIRILKLLGVVFVYEMTQMYKKESLELFCWHAFRQASPRGGYSELSRNVVAYCGGLPLALEVLGSYLFERSKQEWISVLSKLEKIPNDEVQVGLAMTRTNSKIVRKLDSKLRISYDGLKYDTEKDIFLDICCFFIGKDIAYVTEILNGCGLYADIGIAVLIDRGLLKVEKNNKIGMQDLIRDMGREIVRQSSVSEPGKRSRLWFHEDVHDVLEKNTGTKTVEALILNMQRTGRVSYSTDAFQDMQKLRLLKLNRVDLTGDFGHLSKQLRWVNWRRPAFNFVPDDFDQENLVVFELKHSNVNQVWKEAKLLQKLKILNLSHSRRLKSTPDFSKLPNLEKLIMKDCPSLSNIHPSIGDLKNLLLINLKDCTSLAYLPKEIYHLRSLITLILSGCSKIDKLEEDIGKMESLETLIAANTGVKQVPFSIVKSKSIAYISLCGYEGLSRDIFPSIIWSWLSPIMNSSAHIPPFGGLSKSLVSLDIDSKNLGLVHQSRSSSKLRSVRVQCHSEIQLKEELRRFLYDLFELETSQASQTSEVYFKSILIGMGSCQIVNETLGKNLSQGLTTNKSSASFLPRNNLPAWLAYTSGGPSVCFQVPKDSDCGMKGITLLVVYSSTLENMAHECLTSVLIINYTKFTIQIYKRDTIMSFNDEDWKGVVSNLGVGEDVEIYVAFGNGLTVQETTVFLIYGESTVKEIESSITVEVEPIPEVEVQPSPDVKTEPSPGVEAQRSPDVKMESEEMAKLNLSPKPTVVKQTDSLRNKSISFLLESDITGREDEKKEIINLLRQPRGNISSIAIVGMGGIGKTTLAQFVYNDVEVQNRFEKKMWVCVSRNFDVKTIVKKMLESLTNCKIDYKLSIEYIQHKLHEHLAGERYLLVLDDIWNVSHEKWTQLKTYLMCGSEDSKVLMTTRDASVEASNHYSLNGLTLDESWSMLKEMIFRNETNAVDQKLESIGKQIAEKCMGLPLAIRTLGGLLQSKSEEMEWIDVLPGVFSELGEHRENIILPILKMSYQNLSPRLRQCFAYCSLFPEDWEIEKDLLIQLWMAQGYLQCSNEKELMEDVGEEFVKIFLMRSFFQDAKVGEDGDIVSFKMHDLMRDLAMQVADNDCCYLDSETTSRVERPMHVSLESKAVHLLDSLDGSRLQSLILLSSDEEELNAEELSVISKFKQLRVLKLSNCSLSNSSRSIGKMKHLRYLNLSNCRGLGSLYKSLSSLVLLQTLILTPNEKVELSTKVVSKLIYLRHLHISDWEASKNETPFGYVKLSIWQQKRMIFSNWFSSLTNIVEISFFLCASHQYLPPLEHLPFLKSLHISFLEELEYIYYEQDFSPAFFPSLESLSLHFCYKLKGWWRMGDDNNRLQNFSLPPFPRLSQLSIIECPMLTCMPIFPYLENRLKLYDSGVETLEATLKSVALESLNDLPPLSKLKSLHIAGASLNMKSIPKDWIQNLTSLKLLQINWFSREAFQDVETWFKDDLKCLPSLQIMAFHNCEDLEALPDWICNLSSLQHLRIYDCINLASLPEGISSLTNLQTIEIIGCPLLVEECQTQSGETWLRIGHIPKIILSSLH